MSYHYEMQLLRQFFHRVCLVEGIAFSVSQLVIVCLALIKGARPFLDGCKPEI